MYEPGEARMARQERISRKHHYQLASNTTLIDFHFSEEEFYLSLSLRETRVAMLRFKTEYSKL